MPAEDVDDQDPYRFVHPDLVPFIPMLRDQPPTDFSLGAPAIRAQREAMPDLSPMFIEDVEIFGTEDLQIPVDGGTIFARLYHPVDPAGGLRPAHVHIHGGGFWHGSVVMGDRGTRVFAARSGLSVVSLDYRLAPEYRWPIPAEDCYAATAWVAENAASLGLDAAALSVGGDSAGGNLAAVVALMSRDRGGPALVAQLLSIPALDLTFPESNSTRLFGTGFGLTNDEIVFSGNQYIDQADASHPYASPLLADDLSGLPPAVVVNGLCDPLADQADLYVEALGEAGVPVWAIRCEGHGHGSMFMTKAFPSASAYTDQIIAALHEARAV